jgi:hypothetical protein
VISTVPPTETWGSVAPVLAIIAVNAVAGSIFPP